MSCICKPNQRFCDRRYCKNLDYSPCKCPAHSGRICKSLGCKGRECMCCGAPPGSCDYEMMDYDDSYLVVVQLKKKNKVPSPDVSLQQDKVPAPDVVLLQKYNYTKKIH